MNRISAGEAERNYALNTQEDGVGTKEEDGPFLEDNDQCKPAGEQREILQACSHEPGRSPRFSSLLQCLDRDGSGATVCERIGGWEPGWDFESALNKSSRHPRPADDAEFSSAALLSYPFHGLLHQEMIRLSFSGIDLVFGEEIVS